MSNIRKEDIGKDISLIPIEIVMRDQKPDNFKENNFNIIVNLHPTDGTHWVLVIRREGVPVYYFDSFGVETPPLFLEEYVDLGSNERIQQYGESYCGAYCLYMIYLIDKRFKIKFALYNLINQVKCQGKHNECLCLGCKVEDKDIVDDNVNVNGFHPQRTTDGNVNQGTCLGNQWWSHFADVNGNVDHIDSEYEVDIYVFRGKPPRVKPLSSWVSTLQIIVNDSLQSWLDDDEIIVNAIIPESLRCVIGGPGECGETFLLKNLFSSSIQFDKLYIIGPTGDQYEDLKKKDIVIIKETKDLPPPDQLPTDIRKLMIFDDFGSRQSLINEYFCRGRHSNCNTIYLKQNILSADRQNVRDDFNLFIFFEQEVELPQLHIIIFLIDKNLVMMILVAYVKRCGKSLIITLSLINLKTEMLIVN